MNKNVNKFRPAAQNNKEEDEKGKYLKFIRAMRRSCGSDVASFQTKLFQQLLKSFHS